MVPEATIGGLEVVVPTPPASGADERTGVTEVTIPAGLEGLQVVAGPTAVRSVATPAERASRPAACVGEAVQSVKGDGPVTAPATRAQAGAGVIDRRRLVGTPRRQDAATAPAGLLVASAGVRAARVGPEKCSRDTVRAPVMLARPASVEGPLGA